MFCPSCFRPVLCSLSCGPLPILLPLPSTPPYLIHFAQLVPVFQKADNSGGSRPSYQAGGGGGHPDPEIREGDGPAEFFRPFGPEFGLKIREGTAPQLVSLKPLLVSDLSGG